MVDKTNKRNINEIILICVIKLSLRK